MTSHGQEGPTKKYLGVAISKAYRSKEPGSGYQEPVSKPHLPLNALKGTTKSPAVER